MEYMKKVGKSKLIGHDGKLMAKILITNIQLNFALISSESVMRQHKLT